MNVLDTTDTVFQLAARSTTTYHVARDPQLECYWRKVGELQSLIGDQELDSEWTRANQDLRRYRYDASRIPLPFSHPYLTSRIGLAALQEVVGLGEFTRPDLAPTALQCLELLDGLIQSDRNPLLEVGGSLVGPEDVNSSFALILAHSRYLVPVRDFCREVGLGHIDVLEQNALRRAACWDSIIVVGSVGELGDFVFSSPRAREIHATGFPWHQIKWGPTTAFLGGRVGKASHRQLLSHFSQARSDIEARSDILERVNLEQIQERLLESEAGENGAEAQGNDRVTARLHELFGGKGVLLEASDRKATMILDLEADKDDRVRQVADNAIEQGMYVVLRTDSEDGYIIPIADQLLGVQSTTFRQLQAEWKTRLRIELEKRGTDGLVSILTAHRSKRANYQNIQNWLSPLSIAPELDEDFQAIARACGLESRFPEMKTVAKRLRTAHTIAGQRVRRQLRGLVRDADATKIDLQGYQSFNVPELPGAQLTAFRVERRSTSVILVPASATERVFDLSVF